MKKGVMQDLQSFFPERIKKYIKAIDIELTEIRLHREKPLILMRNSEIFFINLNGRITKTLDENSLFVSSDDTECFFYAICRNSVHSFQEEIRSGFITLPGGHRVGICGTAVMRDGVISNIKNVSGFNIRISREMVGCSEEIFNSVFCGGLKSVLVAGVPSSGKTTILRDLCRILGNKYKVSLIDERSEIAAVYEGVPQNDVGINTDVFDRYSKADGLETAVRVMSPDIIIFDEAGSQNEFGYMEDAINCGIRICASVHASSFDEIKQKLPFWSSFDFVVILGRIPSQELKIFRTEEL